VFKGSYQERPVAIKVVQLYSSDREVTLRVGVLVMSILLVIFLTHDPEILQRSGDLETPSPYQYPPVGRCHAWPRTLFDGFELDGKRDHQSIR